MIVHQLTCRQKQGRYWPIMAGSKNAVLNIAKYFYKQLLSFEFTIMNKVCTLLRHSHSLE